MKPCSMFLLVVVCALGVVAIPGTASAAAPPERQVAITIDDLPAGAANAMSAAAITEMTTRLLTTLRDEKSTSESALCVCGSTTVLNWAITPSVICR
jgi:hypothetical protein